MSERTVLPVPSEASARLEQSREKLLQAIGSPPDLTLIRPHGNIGDQLIQAGTRRLLSRVPCKQIREIGIGEVRASEGHTALLGGSGGWCRPFHGLAGELPAIEKRFERVIVMPSSFDTAVEPVRRALERTRAQVFAREEVSFERIRSLCRADLAHDGAFFFDFEPYALRGAGLLTAFRTDEESAFRAVPPNNRDLSVECSGLDEWLWVIARHELIRTDRAHVTIAGALLGKRVEYLASSYHKVPALVDFSLRGYDVTPIQAQQAAALDREGKKLTDAGRFRLLEQHLVANLPEGSTYLWVDDGKLHSPAPRGRTRVPFLERNGIAWGAPKDDAQAISELDRMRAAGAEFLAIAWPAFWWLEHYAGFARHLAARHTRVVADDVLVCFDLRD